MSEQRKGPAPKMPPAGGGPRGPRGFGPRQPLDKKALVRLMGYLKPYWPRLILVLACIVLNAVATAMAAKFLGTVIDKHIMPALAGEMTLQELVRRDLKHHTPIIALTADAIVGAKENYLAMGFTDYLSKPVKYENLEQVLKLHLPKEKQIARAKTEETLPVMLLWGTDADRLRDEKDRLQDIYKCVCVVGSTAKEKYLSKHKPDGVMQVF